MSAWVSYQVCNVSILQNHRVKPKLKRILINKICIKLQQNKTYKYCNHKSKKKTNSNSV